MGDDRKMFSELFIAVGEAANAMEYD